MLTELLWWMWGVNSGGTTAVGRRRYDGHGRRGPQQAVYHGDRLRDVPREHRAVQHLAQHHPYAAQPRRSTQRPRCPRCTACQRPCLSPPLPSLTHTHSLFSSSLRLHKPCCTSQGNEASARCTAAGAQIFPCQRVMVPSKRGLRESGRRGRAVRSCPTTSRNPPCSPDLPECRVPKRSACLSPSWARPPL